MDGSYWSNISQRRIGRRRALAALGGATAAGVVLAACGGGGGSGANSVANSGNANSLVASPSEVKPAQAKRGGVMKDSTSLGDPPTLNPDAAINPLNPPARLAYNTLVKSNVGIGKASDGSIIGDLAESYERSPDGLQITMKLRDGLKWHNKAPLNGRAFDVGDVTFTWDRFVAKSANRAGYVNSLNPAAPILSVTAADAKTVVIKLSEPVVYALDLFASNPISYSGSILVMPKETDTTFNIGTDMIGTGPYVMANYTPSVGFTMKRFPDFYDKDWGLFDEIDFPIITEYAAGLGQFKAGNVYQWAVKAEDLVSVKQEEPRILIFANKRAAASNPSDLTFGLASNGTTKSPFLDERVRQAVSMSWDRDLYIDTFSNVSKFQQQGFPVDPRWNSALSDAWDGWWLDPKDTKTFGPNAQYFQQNIAAAKQLMSAAGYPNGFDVASRHIVTSQLGALPQNADVLDGMAQALGITTHVEPADYLTQYIPNIRDAHGQYTGWGYHTNAGGTGVGPAGLLSNEYYSKGGSAFHGFTTSGTNDQQGDPQVDAMIAKARIEPDTDKRKALVQDIQRYLAKPMYALPLPGDATGFLMAWPAVGNFGVYFGVQVWAYYHWWLDDTKPPVKST